MSGCEVCGWEDYEPICPSCLTDLTHDETPFYDESRPLGPARRLLLDNGVPVAVVPVGV